MSELSPELQALNEIVERLPSLSRASLRYLLNRIWSMLNGPHVISQHWFSPLWPSWSEDAIRQLDEILQQYDSGDVIEVRDKSERPYIVGRAQRIFRKSVKVHLYSCAGLGEFGKHVLKPLDILLDIC